MAMTMKVYEVDRYGQTVRVVQPETEVTPLTEVDPSSVFPACQCQQCKDTA
ncbi:hypothetical protein ACFWFI_09785 [Streptomyces sp. NPDC060209]|uniref:hypothetical protein n=1 Tax=Streptomyces sp. NPDC060209 TaxID=3347073 RepID=UPI003662DCBD